MRRRPRPASIGTAKRWPRGHGAVLSRARRLGGPDGAELTTGWEPLGISVDWAAIEGELGVPLPADYKELYEVFGGGVFSDSV
ncbi:SMI1/KNR4 family protein [Streptomyces lydicus]|uniref:SMI1/KNR4 family protein n=1 Tax=Streptomyces lydicus TaxID=47763 RepID=UPI00342634FA